MKPNIYSACPKLIYYTRMQVINIVITEFNFVRRKTKLLQLTLRLRQKIGANLLTLSSVGRPTFWWEKPQGTMRFRNSLTMHKRSKQKLTKFTKVNNGWHFCLVRCNYLQLLSMDHWSHYRSILTEESFVWPGTKEPILIFFKKPYFLVIRPFKG